MTLDAATDVRDRLWDALVSETAAESPLWAASALAAGSQRREPVFSPLLPDPALSLGVETIYEGYLAHYGCSRLFAPADDDSALLLGDHLLAHGLVRIAASGSVAAVLDLADLLSLCAQARADGRPEVDGAVWAATTALLGAGDARLEPARRRLREHGDATQLERVARSAAGDDAVAHALAAHRSLVG